jgi:SAM-dependent methyltransferase
VTEYTLEVSEAEVQRYRLMAAHAVQTEAALWQLAGIVPGAVVADVGCGPAAMSVELAKAVSPGGHVIGVERDDEALRAARAVVAASGADVELRRGEASATGLAPGSVDVAVLRHVLAHNGGAEQAVVDHLADVVRPGGSLYVVDVDLVAIRIVGADLDLDDLVERYAEFHRRRGNDPLVGLRLRSLLEAAGLEVVTHEGHYNIIQAPPGMRPPAFAAREAMVADGVVTDQDVARWQAAFRRDDTAPVRPTIFAPVFVAIGRRPA